MIEPKVGQFWVHKDGHTELCIERIFVRTKVPGLQARWKNTTGFISMDTLRRNYRYDRVEPKTVLEAFGVIYSDMTAMVIERLEPMGDAELISTLDAAELLDDHCWWATWNVREEVRSEARRILHNRRPPFERLSCGRVDIHLPHMWDGHIAPEGKPLRRQRYYCRGDEPREPAARAPIPTRVADYL